MTAKTGSKPRVRKPTPPPTIVYAITDGTDFVQAIQAIKDAHYAREDRASADLATLAKMGVPFAVQMLTYNVVHAAEHALRIEHGARGEATPDVLRAREQFTKTLAAARDALGDKFDASYATSVSEHNECARRNLDNSNGLVYAFIIPAFEADGTHAPLGPKDFPWAREV